MRLLEQILINAIKRYFPSVDTDALRVNLLSQTATLSNVDLCPSTGAPPTLLLGGIPFAVQRPSSLRSLRVALPNGVFHARVSGLRGRLALVPYDRASGDPGVRDALIRAKRTALAEGERQASGVFASLAEQWTPLLFQRLHFRVDNTYLCVELPGGHLVEIHIATVFTDALADEDGSSESRGSAHSSSIPGGPESPEPLMSKSLVVRGLEVRLDKDVVVSLPELRVGLKLVSGILHMHVNILNTVMVALNEVVVSQVNMLKRESAMWQVASLYKRPMCSPRRSACDWWRYAVRVVTRSGAGGRLESDLGLSRLRLSVEYYHLHTQRLKSTGRIASQTLERCKKLEDEFLDTETVLLLRARARRSVVADEAARFAAEHWLAWMLAGSGESSEERRISKDISAVISSVHEARENADSLVPTLASLGFPSLDVVSESADAAAAEVTGWSGACLSFRASGLSVSFDMPGPTPGITIETSDMRAQYLSNSSVDTSADMSFGSVGISDRKTEYVLASSSGQKVTPAAQDGVDGVALSTSSPSAWFEGEGSTDSPGSTSEPLVSLAVRVGPRSYGQSIDATVSLAPVIFAVDVTAFLPVIHTFSLLADPVSGVWSSASDRNFVGLLPVGATDAWLRPPFHSLRIEDSSDQRPRAEKDDGTGSSSTTATDPHEWSHRVRMEMKLRSFSLLLLNHETANASTSSVSNSVLLSIRELSLNWAPFSKITRDRAEGRLSVEVMLCLTSSMEREGKELLPGHGDVRSTGLLAPGVRTFPQLLRGPEQMCQICDVELITRDHALLVVSARSAFLNMSSKSVCSFLNCIGTTLGTWELDARAIREKSSHVLIPAVASVPAADRSKVELDYIASVTHSWIVPDVCQVEVPRVVCTVQGPNQADSFRWRIEFSGLAVSFRSALSSLSSLSIMKASIFDTSKTLVFELNSSANSDESAFKVDISRASQESSESEGLSSRTPASVTTRIRVANIKASLHHSLLPKLSDICLPVLCVLSKVFGSNELSNTADCDAQEPGHAVQAHEISEKALRPSLSEMTIMNLEVGLDTVFFDSVLRITDMRLVGRPDSWTLGVKSLSLEDHVSKVSSQSWPIRLRHSPDSERREQAQCLQVTKNPRGIEVHLSAVCLIILRSYVECAWAAGRDFASSAVSLADRIVRTFSCGYGNDHTGTDIVDAADVRDEDGLSFRLVASDTMVMFPGGALQDAFVALDVRDLTVRYSRLELGVFVSTALFTSFQSHGSRRYESRSVKGGLLPVISLLNMDVSWASAEEGGVERRNESGESMHGLEKKVMETLSLAIHQTVCCSVSREQMAVIQDAVSQVVQNAHDASSAHYSRGGEGEAMRGPVSHRVSCRIDAPGITLDFHQSADILPGSSAQRFSRLNIGHVCVVGDRISRIFPQAPKKRTVVTRVSLDFGAVRLFDDDALVPDIYKLVMCLEGRPCGDVDTDQASSGLSVSLHTFSDGVETTECKIDVSVPSFLCIFQPRLVNRFLALFNHRTDVSVEGDSQGLCNENVFEDGGRTRRLVAATKFSIVFEEPQLFILESFLSAQSRALEVSCSRLKLNVFLNDNRELLPASQVRVRNVEFALRVTEEQRRTDALGSHVTEGSPSILLFWSQDNSLSPAFLRVSTVLMRMPSVVSSSVYVAAMRVSIDATAEDIASLLSLVPVLSLSDEETESLTGTSGLFPPVEVSLPDVEIIMRIPQHRLPEMRLRSGGDGASLVRAKLALQVFVSQNGSVVDVELTGRGLRAFDGQTGLWDRRNVIDPCSFLVNTQIDTHVLVSVRIASVLRIHLSPLIVKCLSNFLHALSGALHVVQVSRSEYHSERNGIDSESKSSPAGGDSQSLRFECLWNQFEVYLVSDTVSVLCCVSGIEVHAAMPLANHARSLFAVRIGEFRVTNEALGRRHSQSGRDWSALLSSNSEIYGLDKKNRFSALTEGVEGLLLPFRMARSRFQGFREKHFASSRVGTEAGTLSKPVGPGLTPLDGRPRPGSGVVPALVAIIQLESIEKGVDVRLGISGIDVGLDLDVVVELVQWLYMALDALELARKLYRQAPSPKSDVDTLETEQEVSTTSGASRSDLQSRQAGRFIVESFGLKVSVRAPQSSGNALQASSLWRLVERAVGSEYSGDITVLIPRVYVPSGSEKIAKLVSCVGDEYRRALLSSAFLIQLGRQVPSLVLLGRVGVLAALRRRRTPLDRRQIPRRSRVEGLLELIYDDDTAIWDRGQCVLERVSMIDASQIRPRQPQATPHSSPSSEQRRIGMASHGVLGLSALASTINAADLEHGYVIFTRLRSTDSRLQLSKESYRWFLAHSREAGLLVTDGQLLVVDLRSCSIIEPRIPISGISHYVVPRRGQARIVVHFNQRPGVALSQLRNRSTGALIEAVGGKEPFIVFCRDRATADALAKMLPTARNFEPQTFAFEASVA